jgi:DNA (cytosine-5)-methyltransferase 1
MTFGSLFAGIGGFDLGLERAGMKCVWQVENDDYCNRVLAKHWPKVRRWKDVRDFPPEPQSEWKADLICGGFPCQDISNAGPKTGISGERSALWTEFARIIRLLRPRIAVMENVPSIRSRGLSVVLAGLAASGFDAEWDCIPASRVGANYQRDRFFLVAFPQGQRGRALAGSVGQSKGKGIPRAIGEGDIDRRPGERERFFSGFSQAFGRSDWWVNKPDVGRLVHGVPGKLVIPRNHALGNAVVPQIAEWIGRRIIDGENVCGEPSM